MTAPVTQEADAAHKEALVLAEDQIGESAKTLEEERNQRRRMLEAAAAGQISLQAISMPSVLHGLSILHTV